MDGRNSTGSKISLLNDNSDAGASSVPAKRHLPPLAALSRASSCASTPSLSPQTPHLVRCDSSDSRGFSTPSPLTPSFGSFDQVADLHAAPKSQRQQYQLTRQSSSKMDEQHASMYPPIPDAPGAMSAYALPLQMQPQMMPPQLMSQQYRTSDSPVSEPSRVSAVPAVSNAKAQGKKNNHYPCPMATAMNCTDFFTTSGHAARHAKKHTGKKDAFCPECNKAFTRKDNMEQHRRTHQSGRSAARSGDESKVKKPVSAKAKKTTIKAEPLFEAAIEQQLAEQQLVDQHHQVEIQAQAVQAAQQPLIDQALMMPPVGPYFLSNGMDTGPVPSLPLAMTMADLNGIRPPLYRSNFTNSLEYVPPTASMSADPDALHYSHPSPGLSNGLNSLALAASEHQRRLSEEQSQSRSPRESPSQESP
ncbi:hypothetical protein LTR08_006471 [Meristemomyces frigidus]|nr:hypothetical protein LTR08_006471 [Meristemomyces frigidus]